ncbi:alcohol dehydrogenase catalytic domain-containing protein [Emcibacter sp.]|uniref:alcohol dehydrogenase catalytic domain-containing protein n=1 Tax=Emcibacter sp. TaxID=1979954 RepID=UPI002AA7B46B|nr:alcohol dehydrogenase catalytic domain-containing protein [Emcibacter sp.]
MKAALFKGLHKPLEVENIPDPTPGEGQVVVKVGRCGICGSDLHMTEDPAFGITCDTVLGHEFSGEVVATGKGVTRLKTGDNVSVIPLKSCGKCARCLAGQPAWCKEMELQGGGYGEYAVTSEQQCIKIPDSLSLEDGALVEPLAVGLHGVVKSGLKPGDRILVLGAGPIGLAVAFWARRMGALHVAVADINNFQENRAYAMGATAFFTKREDLVDAINTNMGSAPDIVFECVGLPGLIAQSVDHVKVQGKIVVLGLCTMPDTFIPFEALSKEVCIQTSAFFEVKEFQVALDALEADKPVPQSLITETVSLQNMPETFEGLRKRTTQCKVMVNPGT